MGGKSGEVKEKKLNPRQELFCKYYASDREFFGNGVQSYIEAYEPDQTKQNWYNTARAVVSEMLTNPNIFNRINELLDLGGLNDLSVDKQLSFVIHQHSDFSSKTAAIREYNKLKQRIVERQDITSKGQAITPILGGSVGLPGDNRHPQDPPPPEAD